MGLMGLYKLINYIIYIYICSSIAIQFVAAGIASFDIWMYKLSERMYSIVCHCPVFVCGLVWMGKAMAKACKSHTVDHPFGLLTSLDLARLPQIQWTSLPSFPKSTKALGRLYWSWLVNSAKRKFEGCPAWGLRFFLGRFPLGRPHFRPRLELLRSYISKCTPMYASLSSSAFT